MRKIHLRFKALRNSICLGLLTLFVVTTVLPVAAQHSSTHNIRWGLISCPVNHLLKTLTCHAERNAVERSIKGVLRFAQNDNYSSEHDMTGKNLQSEQLANNLVIQAPDASNLLAQGLSLYEAGRFSDAVTTWQQAAQDYEAQGDWPRVALIWNYLSLAYQDLGRWQDAENAVAHSLAEVQTHPTEPKSNPPLSRGGENGLRNPKLILAQILNTKGSLQLTMGQAEAALNTWKQAELAYTQAKDEAGILGSQINQAQALQTLGLYRRAQTTLEQVNQQLLTSPDLVLKATGLRSLGMALQVVGSLEESQKALEQSLAITQQLEASNRAATEETSAVLFSLGNTARALQNFEKALAYYQQAAATATNPMAKVEAQLNQLSLNVQTGQWKAANILLPQIQSQLTHLSPSRAVVYAQVNLAGSLMRMGSRVVGAGLQVPERLGDDSANPAPTSGKQATIGQNPPSSGAQTIQSSSQSPILNSQAVAQLLAQSVQQARNLKDPRAESYALGQLGQLYTQTQQWSEGQSLTQQALQIAQAINASDIAYRWQWQLGQILKQQGKPTEAIAAYKEAVNTLQSLRSDLVAINPDVQFSFRESVEPIYREFVGLLLQPPQSPPDQGGIPSQENLKQARRVIESLQLAELDNFFREACLTAKPQQIDQVDPTAATIYPIILLDRLAVILSLPEQPLRYYETRLPKGEVESILDQMLQSLNPAVSKKVFLRLSQQVYDWLIRPAEAELARSGVKTLVFVLDDALRNLPMATLHDGQKYLVEKYSIALSPGLQLLEPRSLARGRLKALIGGLTEARQGFSGLPAVASELRQIASRVSSEILLNQKFAKTTLENQINAVPFEVVHFATHGQFSSKAEDTFLLAWDARINVKDLHRLVREREERNPIELLVLSACQTAAGDKRATLGLAGVAVRSGARSTLATLWSVRDGSTSDLMAEFYRQLTQPEISKAEALRQAQLSLLKNAKYEHPFYWAPFILVGNWL